MAIVKRVYTDVSEKVFYNMIQRAKSENAFVDEKGIVNIGKLLSVLVETYGEGNYTILQHGKKALKPIHNQNGWENNKN
jgi:hypothetical protein